MKRAVVVVAVSLVQVCASPALAAPPKADEELRAEARATATRGDEQFAAGRCDKAITLWRAADVAYHAPTIQLRIARCQALLGKVVEAAATLEAIAREPLASGASAAFVGARDEARRDLPAVRARIARITLALQLRSRSFARVTHVIEIDNVPVDASKDTFEVDPGDHVVRVRAERATWERRLRLGDGERNHLRVALWADPEAPSPRAQRTMGFAVGAFGVASVVTGAAFGASALLTAAHLDGVCGADRRRCPPDEQGALSRVRTHATLADVLLGGGAALVATGVILVVTEARPKGESLQVRIAGGPRALSLEATF